MMLRIDLGEIRGQNVEIYVSELENRGANNGAGTRGHFWVGRTDVHARRNAQWLGTAGR